MLAGIASRFRKIWEELSRIIEAFWRDYPAESFGQPQSCSVLCVTELIGESVITTSPLC